MSNQVILVGGGLSGLSTVQTVLERGGNVLVLDKNSFFGGNSTSGINGALTNTQIALGVQDSAEIFVQDTARSARDLARPDLIKVLTGTGNSASAVVWLQEKFRLDLSLVSRLGEMFPGMTITYALMKGIEEISNNQPDRARLIKNARVTKLIKEEYGPVILATGGYAANFTEDSLLKKYRKTTRMEKVQPDVKNKFSVAEALRGVGRLFLNGEGKRFCDELGHRDYVTASQEIEWHCKHYVGRGLMRKFSGEALAKEIALMSAVSHYTMGGIDINAESEVRDMQEQVIPGLFASWEIAHGFSLLGCVVYGRIVGDSASRYLCLAQLLIVV
ncbi:hypothetical protein C2G38_2133987 [Gigaspora rosea]|uniref:FAD-dependent oxidoreductase 2 FAD-binding domain-containing protein n=1 Tax=Gigaspora rosea TaxID=44941 RepID=A0A397VZD4_9GLOM|nr:hypothetical protein C2G38_2133987 [Gigaspora rosea]